MGLDGSKLGEFSALEIMSQSLKFLFTKLHHNSSEMWDVMKSSGCIVTLAGEEMQAFFYMMKCKEVSTGNFSQHDQFFWFQCIYFSLLWCF